MKEQLQLKNHLKEVRTEANLSQAQLAEMAGVSRNTISFSARLLNPQNNLRRTGTKLKSGSKPLK